MKDHKLQIKLALSAGLTLLAAYLLSKLADFSALGSLLSGTRTLWFAVALMTYSCSLGIRGLRLSIMYPDEPLLRWHLRTASITAVMNFLLPARLGEFSIVALVSKRLSLGIGGVALSIFAIRVQELVCTLSIVAVLIFFGGEVELSLMLESIPSGVGLIVLIGSGVLTLFGIALVVFRRHRMFLKSNLHMRNWRIWGCSALVSICMFLLIFSIAEWLNIAEALAITPLIFLAALLVSFLPVNGIANVGGYHMAWALPLITTGYASDVAVSLSILAHLGLSALILVAAVLVLGMDFVELRRGALSPASQGKTGSEKP